MSRDPAVAVRRDWGADDDGCWILHVDMDAFFASVELLGRPDLRGRPVIVGGQDRSVVLAATYEARAFGVHSAMPMTRARQMCPQAVVLPPDHRRYREASDRVMRILREVTGLVEQLSIDEAFLDVRGAVRRLGSPARIGAAIRQRVAADLALPCSVGVAGSKFVAKLASVHAKPDGMLVIPVRSTVPFLWSLPVRSLWGVGDKTAAALARYGLVTVEQLAQTDVLVVQRAVGRVAGAHLHDLAWGRDPRAVEPTREERSVGAETTFDQDVADPVVVEAKALELADRVAGRLRRHGQVCRTVSIKVRTSDFRTLTRSRTLPAPTDVARDLYLVARALLGGVDLRGLPVRLVGVRAEGLRDRDAVAVQHTLEEALTDAPEQRRDAEEAMDRVRDRFGYGAISIGTRARSSSTTVPRQDELS